MSADDMTPDEVASFSEFVAGTVVSSWAHAADARTADLAALWAAGADQGWFELGTADALAAALAAMRELGRVACPLPVIDGFAAARLLRGDDKLAHQLAAGELGVLVTSGTSQGRNEDQSGVGPGYLDAAVAATHVLVLPPHDGPARLCPIMGRRDQPGGLIARALGLPR